MDEKLVSVLNDARLIAACDNVIFPMIRKKIEERVQLMSANFRGGLTRHDADVAYITALYDIELDLKSLQSRGNKILEKLGGENER